MESVRLLIAHSNRAYRVQLRKTLEDSREQIEVIADARTSKIALERIEAKLPDISMVEIDLVGAGGLELTRQIRQSHPTCSVILLANQARQEDLFHAVRYGAAAYLEEDVSRRDLLDTIVRVCAGSYVIDDYVLANPALAGQILSAFRDLAALDRAVRPLFEPLSGQEIAVLEHAAQGISNKQIARAMGLTNTTVKNHVTSVLRKLTVNDRTHAVVYAMQHGWLKLPEL